jgi:hypothetical protein
MEMKKPTIIKDRNSEQLVEIYNYIDEIDIKGLISTGEGSNDDLPYSILILYVDGGNPDEYQIIGVGEQSGFHGTFIVQERDKSIKAITEEINKVFPDTYKNYIRNKKLSGGWLNEPNELK